MIEQHAHEAGQKHYQASVQQRSLLVVPTVVPVARTKGHRVAQHGKAGKTTQPDEEFEGEVHCWGDDTTASKAHEGEVRDVTDESDACLGDAARKVAVFHAS